jgi:hypothetical protein
VCDSMPVYLLERSSELQGHLLHLDLRHPLGGLPLFRYRNNTLNIA